MNIARVRTTYAFVLSAILVLCSASSAHASYGSYGSYGAYGTGAQNASLLVDKKVSLSSATTKGGKNKISFVDNLASNDPRFVPGQNVYFKIKVKNTSDVKQSNILVKDVLPAYLEPVNMPNYDATTRTVVLTDNLSLEAGKGAIFTVNTKVVGQDQLPTDQGVMCVYNKAYGSNTSVSDDDSAQFCIEKQVIGVTTQPSAGPEYAMGLLALQMIGLGSGLYLKKRVA